MARTKKDPNYTTIKRIKELLAENNMTQVALADELGINPKSLSFAMTGRRNLPDYYTIQISKLFGVSTAWLYGYTDQRTEEKEAETEKKKEEIITKLAIMLLNYCADDSGYINADYTGNESKIVLHDKEFDGLDYEFTMDEILDLFHKAEPYFRFLFMRTIEEKLKKESALNNKVINAFDELAYLKEQKDKLEQKIDELEQ